MELYSEAVHCSAHISSYEAELISRYTNALHRYISSTIFQLIDGSGLDFSRYVRHHLASREVASFLKDSALGDYQIGLFNF